MNIWEAYERGLQIGFGIDKEMSQARAEEIDAANDLQALVERKLRNEILQFELKEILPLKKKAELAKIEAAELEKRAVAAAEADNAVRQAGLLSEIADYQKKQQLGHLLIYAGSYAEGKTQDTPEVAAQIISPLKELGFINENEYNQIINKAPAEAQSGDDSNLESTQTGATRPFQQSGSLSRNLIEKGERILDESNNAIADSFTDTYYKINITKPFMGEKQRTEDLQRLNLIVETIKDNPRAIQSLNKQFSLRFGSASVAPENKIFYAKHRHHIDAEVVRLMENDPSFYSSILTNPEAYKPYFEAAIEKVKGDTSLMSPHERYEYSMSNLEKLSPLLSKEQERQIKQDIINQYIADTGLEVQGQTLPSLNLALKKTLTPVSENRAGISLEKEFVPETYNAFITGILRDAAQDFVLTKDVLSDSDLTKTKAMRLNDGLLMAKKYSEYYYELREYIDSNKGVFLHESGDAPILKELNRADSLALEMVDIFNMTNPQLRQQSVQAYINKVGQSIKTIGIKENRPEQPPKRESGVSSRGQRRRVFDRIAEENDEQQ